MEVDLFHAWCLYQSQDGVLESDRNRPSSYLISEMTRICLEYGSPVAVLALFARDIPD
jgi:hypothetical protein